MLRAIPFVLGTVGPDQVTARWLRDTDGSGADSALAARLASAVLDATQPEVLGPIAADLMLASLPPAVQAEVEASGALDAMMDPASIQAARTLQLRIQVPAYRALLGRTTPADIRQATAFYESEAGRYTVRAAALGLLRVSVPRIADAMRPMLAPTPEPSDG